MRVEELREGRRRFERMVQFYQVGSTWHLTERSSDLLLIFCSSLVALVRTLLACPISDLWHFLLSHFRFSQPLNLPFLAPMSSMSSMTSMSSAPPPINGAIPRSLPPPSSTSTAMDPTSYPMDTMDLDDNVPSSHTVNRTHHAHPPFSPARRSGRSSDTSPRPSSPRSSPHPHKPLPAEIASTKTIYLIRHGVSRHNHHNVSLKSPTFTDASLDTVGIHQATAIGSRYRHHVGELHANASTTLLPLDLILTSPLTRCLETTHLAFSIGPPLPPPPLTKEEKLELKRLGKKDGKKAKNPSPQNHPGPPPKVICLEVRVGKVVSGLLSLCLPF